MYEIDKEKFGQFISQLRKEKGMTQKELAEKLYVSDKAVSKWETGMHLPDIAVLTPLAEILEVSVAELLQGQRMESETVQKYEVEDLLQRALTMEQEQMGRLRKRKRQIVLFMITAIWGAFELSMLNQVLEYGFRQISMPLTAFVIAAVLGAYFVFLAEDRIPAYYDENKINTYSKGPLRMNLPGVYFNNSNWPHITRYIRRWSYCTMLLAGYLFYILDRLLPYTSSSATILVLLLGTLLVPLYVIGKKYG